MDQIWNPHSWPRPLSRHVNIVQSIQARTLSFTPHAYPDKYCEYLAYVRQSENIPVSTFQLALSIASRFSSKNQRYSEPTQLILLVSLFIASKTLDKQNVSVSYLHKISNHSYTNKDIYRTEQKILAELGFDVLGEGVCDFQVQLILELVDLLYEGTSYSLLNQISSDLQVLIWCRIYSGGDKIPARLLYMLPAAVVQITLILCTMRTGRFPATVWMLHILKLMEDELNNFVELLMRVVFGRDKVESLNI